MIKKPLRHILMKIFVLLRERHKKINNVPVSYIFIKNNKSNKLLICFSACGKKANYNYLKTLNSVNTNKLYIKDTYSSNKLGSFYIGGKNDSIENAILCLIKGFVQKYNASDLFFVGSSKGGYAAINYALLFKNSTLIIGAPQYYLVDYMKKSNMESQYNFIVGNGGLDKEKEINFRLKKRIKEYYFNIKKVYLHYSNMEHTFKEHISSLIDDLKEYSIPLIEDCHNYQNHSDVAFYYPSFLKNTISSVLLSSN